MKKIYVLLFVFVMIPVAALGETTTGTATAAGYGGDISVSLVVKDGKLTDVVIKGTNETQGIGTMAIEQMPQAMVNANSVKVDAVSGATRTSTGILNAAAAALAQMNVELTSDTQISVDVPGETTTATATAAGYGGEISVTLTMQGGKLTDVIIKGENETQGIGTMAIEQMPQAMLAANSVKVDGISGATRTSTGILNAAAAALAQMNVEPNADASDNSQYMLDPIYKEFSLVIVGSIGISALLWFAMRRWFFGRNSDRW